MKNSYSFWHFLSRLAGLTGLMAAIVGLVAWLSLDQQELGQYTLVVGASCVGLALLVELRGLIGLVGSRRGAVGFNVVLQVALAIALLVGVNYFSFLHWQRFDWTRDHTFTISNDLREQLARLEGTTDIIVYQMHVSFGQSVDSKQDNYDAAAEHQIVEKVKDLVEMFQEFGPRFRVQELDLQEQSFADKLAQIRKKSKKLADAIEQAPENSIFFHVEDRHDVNGGKVQRLGFQDVYQLDRPASKQADGARGNLVLRYQGLAPFAHKILSVEERKPRIAVANVHRLLGLDDDDFEHYTLTGAKSALESHGFKTSNIILKNDDFDEFLVYTHDESKYESLEDTRAALKEEIAQDKDRLKEEVALLDDLKKMPFAKLKEQYVLVRTILGSFEVIKMEVLVQAAKSGRNFEAARINEKMVPQLITRQERIVASLREALDQDELELDEVTKELNKLNVEEIEEKRRIADLRVKMKRTLADCDLLVISRVTMLDLSQFDPKSRRSAWGLINVVHALDEAQFLAIKDFMRQGKPVLFCLGPSNIPPNIPRNQLPPDADNDPVEQALEQLGFHLPRQTILFPSETKAFARRRADAKISEGGVKVASPPVAFEWKPGSVFDIDVGTGKDNLVRTSARVGGKSLAASKDTEFALRYARPVYFRKPKFAPLDVASVVGLGLAVPEYNFASLYWWKENAEPLLLEDNIFMISDAHGWNEAQPFPTVKRPRYEPARPGDPGYGTIQQRKQKAFPIAANAQVTLPDSWFPERAWFPDRDPALWTTSLVGLGAAPGGLAPFCCANALVPLKQDKLTARVAVIGSGSAFTGKRLTPMKQKLLLDTCNWLLGREDLLARDSQTWHYPRVQFSDFSYRLWQWSTRLGMPLIFVFFGVVMFMVRRMR